MCKSVLGEIYVLRNGDRTFVSGNEISIHYTSIYRIIGVARMLAHVCRAQTIFGGF